MEPFVVVVSRDHPGVGHPVSCLVAVPGVAVGALVVVVVVGMRRWAPGWAATASGEGQGPGARGVNQGARSWSVPSWSCRNETQSFATSERHRKRLVLGVVGSNGSLDLLLVVVVQNDASPHAT